VSLSLRDELRVVMYRDQIQAVRIGCKLTLKGKLWRVIEKKSYPCPAGDDVSYEGTLKVLETVLSELTKMPAFAQVILSNHFMNYAMVEMNQSLNGEAEELAYAKHCFSQLFGSTAADWEFRLNHDHAGDQQLASAVNALFLQNIRAVFARANVKLESIQPYLMAAYNNCHSDLQNQDAWLVLVEHGSLCIGLVRQGHWSSVRTLNVGNDWHEQLNKILDRESFLSEIDISTDTIFLWAPEYIRVDLPKSIRWKIRKLKPGIRASFAADFEEQYAIAMCG
jgi:hypothetical protein